MAKKGTIAAIVGIIVTIVVGLVGTIAGEALSPLGESLKDFLSPPPIQTSLRPKSSMLVTQPIILRLYKVVLSLLLHLLLFNLKH